MSPKAQMEQVDTVARDITMELRKQMEQLMGIKRSLEQRTVEQLQHLE